MTSFDVKTLKGVTQDSRRVKSGYLFAALPGSKTDGRKFIEGAIRDGAVAILAPTGTMLPEDVDPGQVALITDDDPRHKFALMAAAFYGRQPEHIVAVTGTNGKTSTVHFTKQLWKSQGIKAASYGTLGLHGPEVNRSSGMTTPDPEVMHADLADLAAGGVTHLALEASSHGLDQNRLDGVRVQAAAFTNLSQDHLDYHDGLEACRAAKSLLFSRILQKGGTAVLNADSEHFEFMKAAAVGAGHKVVSFGFKGEELKILELHSTPHGQRVALEIFGKGYEITLPMVGAFQVKNALAALGLVLAEGRKAQDAYVAALENLGGAPGRLELVGGHPHGAAVYVDYAHTPDALESVLKALRVHTAGRLVCVMGCGGDRDRSKRPIMGKITHDLADAVIVTDDNPRNEEPEKIRAAILEAAPGALEIGDRRAAITAAIEGLKEGDVLVIAGKGHEQGQIYADKVFPFDDRVEAARAIEHMLEGDPDA